MGRASIWKKGKINVPLEVQLSRKDLENYLAKMIQAGHIPASRSEFIKAVKQWMSTVPDGDKSFKAAASDLFTKFFTDYGDEG